MSLRFALLAFVLATTPAAAQRSIAIKRFEANILVRPDGAVDVTESITAQFTGSWNGVSRSIPVEYRTPQGFSWTLHLEFLGATDGEGHTLKVESARDRHYIKYKMWVPGARDVTRTVVFHYRASNGLRFFEDHDELYWNVTGDEWDVPIEAASAQVHLPVAAGNVRAIAFNGAYGSTAQDAKVLTTGTDVAVAMPKALGFHEGMTVVVGWDKGAVAEPTKARKAIEFTTGNWPLVVPVVVLVAMFLLWRRSGRDPSPLPVAVQYEPPDAITPAEAGTLMDETVDMRDITATMVDLAVGGRIRIEEREEKALLGLWTHREYVFHRLEPKEGARTLAAHELGVLDGIFDGAREVRLSDLQNEFYRHLPGIRSGVYQRLIERGLQRSRPDVIKSRWMIGGVVLGAAIVFLGSTGAVRFNLSPLSVFAAAISSGLIVMLFGRIMPRRTVAGARMLERVKGFEEFLRRVESDRFARVIKTPEMFERFLPYAMAFGVERKWAHAFQDIYREPPNWYVGSSAMNFNASMFSMRLADLSTRAGSTMGSSPRSSGGSGFGGGGSSGGGSGGGGGGGF